MKRLFAAIRPLPDPGFLDGFRLLRNSLRDEKIKWVEEENLHITVKFFGETEEKLIPAISGVLASISSSADAFSYRYAGLGIFGSSYNPRVIWSVVEPYDELSAMMTRLKKELASIGFPADRQNPVPHLTLGRIKAIKDKYRFQNVLDANQHLSSLPMVADRLILYESILSPSGPVYHIVNFFPLRKKSPLAID